MILGEGVLRYVFNFLAFFAIANNKDAKVSELWSVDGGRAKWSSLGVGICLCRSSVFEMV